MGNNLFMCTTHQYLIALDPATGKEKWRFDPKLKADNTFQHLTCRGVSYYDANNTAGFESSLAARSTTSAECPQKVILPVNDGRLVAVNATTGRYVPTLVITAKSICKRHAIPISRRL